MSACSQQGMIYLDNAATTPLCSEARDAWLAATEDAANVSSLHAGGRHAKELLNAARKTVAGALDVPPEALIFTSGGTESVNLALRGAAAHAASRKHIVASALEHPAARETLAALRGDGFAVTTVPPGRDGAVTPDALLAAVTEDTLLVSCVLVAGETGALQDTDALAALLKQRFPNTLLHIDAVQGFLKCPFQARRADYVSISAHKIHAPMGIGALYAAKNAPLSPLLTGGGQENGRRSGTEAWPLAAAFAAAVRAFAPLDKAFVPYMLERLETMGAVPIPGHGAPHIAAAGFPGFRGEVLVRMLSDKGLMIGSGSACHSGKKSAALLSMPWLPTAVREGAVRLSVSRMTTREELARGLDILAEVIAG